MKFRKKPVIIDAIQFDGTIQSAKHIANELYIPMKAWTFKDGRNILKNTMIIHTVSEKISIKKGDWIIENAERKFYSCKPDDFNLIYEPVITGKGLPEERITETHTLASQFVPPIEFQVDPDRLYCPGCGKPKVLCLHSTTGCTKPKAF